MRFSYNLIEPLLVYSEVEGREMHCEFQVPGSHEVFQSSARIKKQDSIQADLTRQVTRMGSNMIRREASRLVRQALGGGMLGRIGSSTVRTTSRHMTQNIDVGVSREEKEAAIVDAFKKVAKNFHFDEAQKAWTEPPAEPAATGGSIKIRGRHRTEVEEHLHKAPLKSRFEKEVLARMLVETANVDGRISTAEKEFLLATVGEEFGSIEDLLAKDPVSQVECEELPPKAKETIYLLSWVMSLVDFDMDQAEQQVLLEYADMMGFSDQQIEEITKKAKLFLLEKTITADTPRAELFEISDQLQLDRNEAERVLIQLKKQA